jgi:PAS domain S-box-containing protein
MVRVFPVEVRFGCSVWKKQNLFPGLVRDITERRRREAKLRESEARFQKAFYSSPVGINLFRISDNRSIDANDTFLELIGYTREEVVGHSASELDLFVDPGTRDIWMKKLSGDGNVRNFEARIRRKSGEIRNILASIEIIDLNGEKNGLVIGVDITDRKKAEEALQRHTDRLNNLHKIDQAILQTFESPDSIAGTALRNLRQLLECNHASVGIFIPEKKRCR